MTTIPLDSRFVNAFVYIVVDVFVFSVLVLALISCQGWFTRRALLRGERVSLREFRFSPLAGGVVADGNRFSIFLVVVHILLLAILFALALGINGVTGTATRPTTRQYLSALDPTRAPVVSDDRVYPQIMASCNHFTHETLTYYPVAFDQEETPSLPVSVRHLRQSLDGNIGTAVNSGSVVCQDYEGAAPLLTVPRCGTDPHSCCNLNLSPSVRVHLEAGAGGPEAWQKNSVRGNVSSLIMKRNVRPVSYNSSSVAYDRLICLSSQGSDAPMAANMGRMNCMLGAWFADEARIAFRLGSATFADSQRMQVFDTSQQSSVQFTAFSVEVEISWPARAEMVLSNGLHSIGGNMVPARLFLDTLVSRSSVPVRVGDEIIFEQYDINVTEVHIAAVVGYAVLITLAVIIVLGKVVRRLKRRRGDSGHAFIPDITTYDGLLMMLHGEEARKRGKHDARPTVEFGITPTGSSFSLGPVLEGRRIVRLPEDSTLRWHRCNSDIERAAEYEETLGDRF